MTANIIDSLEVLGTENLYTHNYVSAVRSIEETSHAVAWLVACAIDIQDTCDPPTYSASVASRINNASFAVHNLDALPDRPHKSRLWGEAAIKSRMLPETELESVRSFIAELSELREAS